MAKKYPFMSYIPPEMSLRKRELRCSTRDEWKRVAQELAQRYTKQYNKREGRELLDINGPMICWTVFPMTVPLARNGSG